MDKDKAVAALDAAFAQQLVLLFGVLCDRIAQPDGVDIFVSGYRNMTRAYAEALKVIAE